MRDLKPMRSLSGHDARCHVCWNAVWRLWIEDEDPAGKCPWGHTRAHDCPDAMDRARESAMLQKAIRESRSLG